MMGEGSGDHSSSFIQHSSSDGIAVLCLLRKAMVPELLEALIEQLGGLAAAGGGTAAPKAAILMGAGPVFCLGADLKWLGKLADPGQGIVTLVSIHHRLVRTMRDAPVPVIAAVNGAAAGGGLSLALAADYCVAAANATFTAAYFRLGLTPDGGNSAFLVRRVGASRTMELLLTNRSLSAEEAQQWGLVDEVAPPERLLERAHAVATGFEPVPAESLIASRRLLDDGMSERLDSVLDREEDEMRAAARRPEFGTALQRFLRRTS